MDCGLLGARMNELEKYRQNDMTPSHLYRLGVHLFGKREGLCRRRIHLQGSKKEDLSEPSAGASVEPKYSIGKSELNDQSGQLCAYNYMAGELHRFCGPIVT